MLSFEQSAWSKGYRRTAGLDEAGRGPLAGPVVAACVLFEDKYFHRGVPEEFEALNDSKQVAEYLRIELFQLLVRHPAAHYGVGIASVSEIDRHNILNATVCAMNRAVCNLPVQPDYLLVDGLPVKALPCASEAIVKGDAQSLSIAAASILAKVIRDRLMVELARYYPDYGFEEHKGYGTAEHLLRLKQHGACPIHRRSFRPVYELAQGDLFAS